MFKLVIALLLTLPSLASAQNKCQASYDERGITYQRVQNLEEYYYCFGHHHAQDRAWEMDYFRRIAQGRNAELYGYTHLKSDLMMKLLDLESLALKLYQGLPESTKRWLELYSQGVNEGFKQGQKAKEFKDLIYSPEPWRPEHSILILVLQSFDQTRKTFIKDYEEEKTKEFWKEKTDELFSENNVPWLNTIIKEGEYQKTILTKTTSIHSELNTKQKLKLWSSFPEVFGVESGSNSWVISKDKSKSKHAIFANDPHLDLKTPMFWYWINIYSEKFNVIGASVPGVPIVVSGTNTKVAWGLTNAYINTADAVFIKDFPSHDIVSFWPVVKFKFGPIQVPFFFKKFERTMNGDVVLPLELEKSEKVLLRWTGFHLKSKHLVPMFTLFESENVTEMDKRLQGVGLPAWNFVFADTQGDIGFRVVGEIYRQIGQKKYGISNESYEDFKKVELLTPSERPHLLKPKRNYIYTANNQHWPVDHRFDGGRGYSFSFRAHRIDELLKNQVHDVETFKKIQCDRQAVDAKFFVGKILKVVDVPEFHKWDFQTDENLVAPAIYRRLMDLLLEHWKINEYALYKILDNLSDRQKNEITQFLKIARDQIKGRTWGELHRVKFRHLSKKNDWNFSPEISGVGDTHSVDPGTLKWDEEAKVYEQYSGASMRMIIEMKKRPEIYLALPGLNRNYTESNLKNSPWQEWRECRYQKIKY